MHWIILAGVIAPLCYALVNHSDKYQIDSVASIKALFLFSGFFTFVVALVLVIVVAIQGKSLLLPIGDITLLLIAGVLEFSWFWLYMKALTNEKIPVSSVAPFFQFVNLFVYVLGVLFLGEILAMSEIVSLGLIVVGGFLLGVNFKELTFSLREVSLMLGASFIIALGAVFFKSSAAENFSLFPTSMFWMSIGMGTTALLVYVSLPSFRNEFHELLRNVAKNRKILGLNISNEVLNSIATILVLYTGLTIYLAKVYAVGSTQYLFVFLISILGTWLYPRVFKEDLSWKNLVPKTIAILLMVVGGILLEWH